jgi:hypothetical protein
LEDTCKNGFFSFFHGKVAKAYGHQPVMAILPATIEVVETKLKAAYIEANNIELPILPAKILCAEMPS